jgi:hypothetical protein
MLLVKPKGAMASSGGVYSMVCTGTSSFSDGVAKNPMSNPKKTIALSNPGVAGTMKAF